LIHANVGFLREIRAFAYAAQQSLKARVEPSQDGIFWIYRLSRLKRDRVVKRFDKMQRTQASGD
jgi:hypothetical protein